MDAACVLHAAAEKETRCIAVVLSSLRSPRKEWLMSFGNCPGRVLVRFPHSVVIDNAFSCRLRNKGADTLRRHRIDSINVRTLFLQRCEVVYTNKDVCRAVRSWGIYRSPRRFASRERNSTRCGDEPSKCSRWRLGSIGNGLSRTPVQVVQHLPALM